ncbi:MAG: energy transducer TonB, partial [Proteobacteria bacterium]|nr:energy transducer TonB [Pseudomonadota bacterium]
PLPLKNMTNSRNTDIMPRPATLNPYRAFEMNPKLPAASMDLVMPDLEKFSMDLPVLKNQYAMGELDSPLIPLVKIPPIYPVRASRRGIEGFVTVEFIVTQKGLVQEIKIIEAEPETIFNKSVIQCVSKWKFLPGTVQGMPVATQAITTIRFELEQ